MKLKTITVLLCIFVISYSVAAFTANIGRVEKNNAPAFANNELELNVTVDYGTKVVHVSFNGNDGVKGLLQVVNESNVVIRQLDEVELIKAPYYFSIDVTDFALGDYKFIITTQKKSYSSIVTIK